MLQGMARPSRSRSEESAMCQGTVSSALRRRHFPHKKKVIPGGFGGGVWGCFTESQVRIRSQNSLGDAWEKSRVDAGGDIALQKRKTTSSSCLGGVWGFYLGCQVIKAEVERLCEISQRSLGLIRSRSFLEKGKIISGSFLGALWGFYPYLYSIK